MTDGVIGLDKQKSIHAGHRERIRERARQEGLTAFSEHEVLELLLTYAIPQKDVNPLAHELVARFGSLSGTLDADEEELLRVPGIGRNAALLLSLMPQLMRYYQRNALGEKPMVTNLSQAYAACAPLFLGAKQEHLYMLSMNKSGRVLHVSLLHTGTVDQVALYPRIVVETALRHGAHAVLLAHNHPGGSREPSLSDRRATGDVASALSMLGIKLIDHLVFSGAQAYSMSRDVLVAGEGEADFGYMRRAEENAAGARLEEQESEWIAMDTGDAAL